MVRSKNRMERDSRVHQGEAIQGEDLLDEIEETINEIIDHEEDIDSDHLSSLAVNLAYNVKNLIGDMETGIIPPSIRYLVDEFPMSGKSRKSRARKMWLDSRRGR